MTIVPTPEQQAIVEFPLAPLRVTAGAGTGKTTTMALRLEHLVRSGLVEPEQALGITFTNKAAQELADRLRVQMPELAREGREVEVTTYHGFAYGLLREFGPLVGVERGAVVVTPGYARQLLREALGRSAPRVLDLTAAGHRVDELARLAGELGDHLRTPGDLLDADPGDPADDVWTRRLDQAAALVEYDDRKRQLGIVDYSDLIARAHQLVTGHPAITERVRDRYRVVLLDEYQDTNPAQRELLRVIFGGGFPVTAVGDADQTIYEWRGASLENFQSFPTHFPAGDGSPAPTLELSHNRRSGRRIVDLANLVRRRIGGPSGLTDGLRPVDDAPDGSVVTAWFHNAVDEAEWLAREVVRLHEDGREWRDIGMLFRRHRQIGLVRDALERHGVPIEVAALGGLLDVPEVSDLHAWLAILGRPDDGAALVRILLGSGYRLGIGDVAPLARWVAAHRGHPRDEEPGTVSWALLEAIDRLEETEGLRDESAERLDSFRAIYQALLEVAQGVSLVELCRRILSETGAWQEVEALDDAARLSARLNLYRFLDLAEEWSPLEGAPSLEAFLEYLDLLIEDRANDELDTARVSGEDAVALLTVHRAKGLEWPVVIVPSVCHGVFPGGSLGYADPTRFPHYLPTPMRLDAEYHAASGEDISEVVKVRHADQEWRTAYVAVTRAKERLVLTGAYWYTEKRAKQPSDLFEIASAMEGSEQAFSCAEPGDPPAGLRLDPVTDGPDPVFDTGWRAALSGSVADPALPAAMAADSGITAAYSAGVDQLNLLLDQLPDPPDAPEGDRVFRTSVTGLVTYATCPKRFYWSEIDRLPRRPAPWMRRGIDLHRKIELHNRVSVPFDEVDDGFYDAPAGDADTPAVASGFGAFSESRFAGIRPILIESPFELMVEGIRVAGRIDAVYEPEPGTWEVVDFKSGRRSDDPARIVQLEAYAVAVADAGLALDPPERTRVSFVYLGDGCEEVVTDVDDEWLSAARAHVAALVTGAASGEYAKTPSAACRHCDFVKFCPEGAALLESGA
ncbi:ATP-dependent helicase [bacterium]|nr:ATP-dependent helicase [bacterium]